MIPVRENSEVVIIYPDICINGESSIEWRWPQHMWLDTHKDQVLPEENSSLLDVCVSVKGPSAVRCTISHILCMKSTNLCWVKKETLTSAYCAHGACLRDYALVQSPAIWGTLALRALKWLLPSYTTPKYIENRSLEIIWANYNNSLTWIVRPFGNYSPY